MTKAQDTRYETGEFSDSTRRQPRKVRRWRVQAYCSRHEQRQPEKARSPTVGSKVRLTIGTSARYLLGKFAMQTTQQLRLKSFGCCRLQLHN